ncbi:MAG TPA: hypothetical protein VIJ46_03345, partial [Rhabdochlamydiaceae bacterium]
MQEGEGRMCISVVDNPAQAWAPFFFNGISAIAGLSAVSALVAAIASKFFDPDSFTAIELDSLRKLLATLALGSIVALGAFTTANLALHFFTSI